MNGSIARRGLIGTAARGLGLSAVLLLPACVVRPAVNYPPVPAPRPEVRPPPPSERLVWAPGHWHWDGRQYEWVPGRWVERPRSGAVWVPGEWVARGGQWVWVPAHWR
ncbi:YXWGXW repeat-containing protein [Acetobacteraceae bacterium H6797]|nr:YXWGXW repeat-containing protein [Acetobacteraceae bacterium H6797]